MGYAYEAAEDEAEDEAEHHRSPRLDEDRASLRVVSGVAGGDRIMGDVDGRYGALRSVRAVDVREYICSGGDSSGNLLSRPWPSPLFTGVRGRVILRSWTFALRGSPKLQAALSSLTSSEVYERSVEGHHGSVEGESFAKVV